MEHQNNSSWSFDKCRKEAKKYKSVGEWLSAPDHFYQLAGRLHRNKFDYSKVNYINARKKIQIICPKHGAFFQTPEAHLKGKAGCPFCGAELRRKSLHLTTKEFIKKARKVHGNKYDYRQVQYIKSSIPVSIICRKHGHGLFKQAPNNHIRGQNCPVCMSIKNGWLSLIAKHMKKKKFNK